jgi:hypothetical protein
VRSGFLAFCALVSGCGVSPAAKDAQVSANTAEAASVPRFDPVAIEAMKKQLRLEPKIKDLVFQDSPDGVEWQIGVQDDGSSRAGFASYVCQQLSERGLVDKATDVRIVDVVKVTTSQGDFRGASLGHVDCTTGGNLGI